MRVLLTGATGFVGQRLAQHFRRPVVLSRHPEQARRKLGDVEAHPWDPERGPPPLDAFRGVEAVFHLAGEPVAEGRWTAAKKQRIRDSRVEGTRQLVAAIAELAERPRVLVSASAVGYYGSRGDEVLVETASPGNDFLSQVCQDWETESQRAASLGVRVVNPRIGIVLGHGGGALSRMLPIFKLGLGGRLANGKQWMPWVHLDDLVGLMRWAVDQAKLSGPVNAVAPNPLRNADFTRALARAVHRPALFPAPALALRLALGEFAQVLLASQRVAPRAALEAGYLFQFPELPTALAAVLEAPTPVVASAGERAAP